MESRWVVPARSDQPGSLARVGDYDEQDKLQINLRALKEQAEANSPYYYKRPTNYPTH